MFVILVWKLISIGLGLLFLLWIFDRLTAKEAVENVIVKERCYIRSLVIGPFFSLGSGSSPSYDRMSRDHYYLLFELEGGKLRLFEVPQGVYEKTFEGTSIKVRCAKGKIFGKRIKSLVQ